MKSFGADVDVADHEIRVSHQRPYRGTDFQVEPDATAASYFLGAAAIASGCITVDGLGRKSKQGDMQFAQCLERMGCQVEWSDASVTLRGPAKCGIDVDMSGFSDTVQTLAVVATFLEGPTTIRGVDHIRHKESDRIGDLARELRKMGAIVEELPDGLRIEPGSFRAAEIETYFDHRMAMSFSLAALKVPGIVISNPICVEKTYPHFFRDFARVTGSKLVLE
jgi:3-phosphoshikimate 1-carboxyvinyltransferase